MKTLATFAIVAALAGCSANPDGSSSFGQRLAKGLAAGTQTFGANLQDIHSQPTPSLQPQRCYVSGQWITCYPY